MTDKLKVFEEKVVTPLTESLIKDASILRKFTIGKPSHENKQYFTWIQDHLGVIGKEMAHYELISDDSKTIHLDIHFEADDENIRKRLVETLKVEVDKSTKWITLDGNQVIRNEKSFKINSPSLIEDIKKALLHLDENWGSKIRKIMNKLENPSISVWEKIINKKYQIILQGAPGTGKTYNAKSLAYQLIFNEPLLAAQREEFLKELVSSDQFALIQFHPAYSYEDFVRGITAKSNGPSIEYITENKILAEFALRAHQNYLDSKKTPEQRSIDQQFNQFVEYVKGQVDKNEEKFVIKGAYIYEVTSQEFKYRGTNANWTGKCPIMDILELYKLGIIKPTQIKNLKINISASARHDSSYPMAILDAFRKFLGDTPTQSLIDKEFAAVPLQNYVLIIDEINRANLPSVLGELIYALEYRGEPVDSMYALDGNNQLILPKNLFIIGTMNTADRSVGHIDYAIRRRFAFLDVLPRLSVVKGDKATNLFKSVAALFCKEYKEQTEGSTTHLEKSEYLAPDFKPEDVMLGHSYFLAEDDDTLKLKLEYEIKPILREYLKDGILLETAKKKIEDLKLNA